MHTIHAHDAFRKRCLDLGADWFFDKASDTAALLEIVRLHVALKPTNHANEDTPHDPFVSN